MKNSLGKFVFDNGYVSGISREQPSGGIMAAGSYNFATKGINQIRGFQGCQENNGFSGSKQYFYTDNAFAGLGTATQTAYGNVFKVKDLLTYIGQGRVFFNGEDLGTDATSILSYLRKIAGSYTLPSFQVGHAKPSSPTIFAKTPGPQHIGMTGAISVVIWRICSFTGQTSLYSLPSNVLVLNNQTPIIPFPLVDANGQDLWGIGVSRVGAADAAVYYELPTELGGEVLETTLAYQRSIGAATITNATDIVDAAGGNFTTADIGRTIYIGAFGSWIKEILSPTQIKTNDVAVSSEAAIGTVKHAVNGYERAVEVHWTNESLLNQNIAPSKAFPPVAARHGGMIQDVAFIETAEGIIYRGEPGFLGSFAPSNAIFSNDRGVLYLRGGDGFYFRFSEQSLYGFAYIGNSIEMQIIWEKAGIKFPQNACIGYGNRVLAWIGKPAMLSSSREPELEFAIRLYPDFDGWNEQTADKPVVIEFDRENYLELWAFGQKVNVMDAPSNKWWSPLDLSTEIEGNIVSMVAVGGQIKITTRIGTDLKFYDFDKGNGCLCKVRTPSIPSSGTSDTISGIKATMRSTSGNDATVKIFRDFEDNAADTDIFNAAASGEQYYAARPNVRNAKSHSVEITMQTDGTSDEGIDVIETFGETNSVFI